MLAENKFVSFLKNERRIPAIQNNSKDFTVKKKSRTKSMGREDTIYPTVQYDIYGEKETMRLAHYCVWILTSFVTNEAL